MLPDFIKDSEFLLRATELAQDLHEPGDKKAWPHPLKVAQRLHKAGEPEYLIAGALVHYSVETGMLWLPTVDRVLGPAVYQIMQAVYPKDINDPEERIERLHFGARFAWHLAAADSLVHLDDKNITEEEMGQVKLVQVSMQKWHARGIASELAERII
jgi:hypothetical protein